MDFTKAQIDNFLYQVAKIYKNATKHNPNNAEIIIIGGSSVLLNYGFRNTTTDIDSYYQSSWAFKDAVQSVKDNNGLPEKWLNNDFKETESFSPKIIQYSKPYKTFCGCLSVRTITDEYLIAMKLKSFRNYKFDLSDIVGILKENIEKGTPITIEKIETAYKNLYNESPTQERIDYLNMIFENEDLEELFYNTKDYEANNRNALLEAEEIYGNAVTKDNAQDFIKYFLEKQSSDMDSEKQEDYDDK